MLLIFVDIILQVVSRMTPGSAIPWTVEMGQILMVVIIWFGMSQGIRRDSHVGFDILIKNRSYKTRKTFGMIANILFIAYLVLLSFMTMNLLNFYMQKGQVTTLLHIPLYYIRLPILLGSICGIVRLIVKSYLVLTDRVEMFKPAQY
jgi:TRAP-type C4-dicarboxylate transport system permease small subunit